VSAADPSRAVDDPGAAFDANFADLLEWYASGPGGTVDRAPDRTIALTRVPFRAVNAVVRADLDPTRARERIAEAVAVCEAAAVPWRWLVGPSSRPLDLGERLAAAGLTLLGAFPAMAVALDRPLDLPAPRVDDLATRRVATVEDLDAWAELQRVSLGLDDTATTAWREAHARGGLGEDVPLRTHIALVDGMAVGSAALFATAGVAGVWNVATHPGFRGRGIGRAMTALVVEEGRARGYRVAVLGASAMGEPVYRAMGFREVARLRNWTLAQPVASQSG
jgi:ribosomal protein S18 acetylase RimI-like enzyme